MEGDTAIERSVKEFAYSKIQEKVYIDVSRSNTIHIRSCAKHGSTVLAMFWLRVLRHQNNYPMPKYPYKEVYDKKGKNKVKLCNNNNNNNNMYKYVFVCSNTTYSCNRVGLRWKVVGEMTGWLGSSVVECSHRQRKSLGEFARCTNIFHKMIYQDFEII